MKHQTKIEVGIMGAAGYTGGELIRLLLNHPNVEIIFAHSKSNAGKLISDVHTDLTGETYKKFSDTIYDSIDVLFLCMGHNESKQFLANNIISEKIKIIDLSQDYRYAENYVYGLPELNRENIKTATRVANPGCFATAIQLALLPLAKNNLLLSDVHVTATTGSTGAGQSFSETSHFSWRQNNLSIYKPFTHQHIAEISKSIMQLQENKSPQIHFIPQRGSFTRGILAAIYTNCEINIDELKKIYADYYKLHPFTIVNEQEIDLKQVVNTNKCILHLQKHDNKLLIISAIDNLIKGASGQAIQNMNLMFGINETEGLKLKTIAF